MAEEKQNEEIAVTEQEATATPAKEQAKETSKKTENKSEKTQKSECAFTLSNIVVWCCLFALAFVTLQYFFVAVAYVEVVRIIFAVFKILCMIGAGVALSVNLVKEKSLKLDVSLVMFLSTMLICLNVGIF